MCENSSDQIAQFLNDLLAIEQRSREPIDKLVQINDTTPYIIDYRERKHIYLWSPNVLTLSFEDFGTGSISPRVWNNLGMPSGIRVLTVGQTVLVPIFIRCTDESIA
jgi:hypothetical protein